MEKTPFLLFLCIAIIALFAANPGFRKDKEANSCEISCYQYGQLHSAMSLFPEVADTARRDLTGEYVSISQYNEIMRKVELAKLKQARRMSAQTELALTEKHSASN
ncbi:hypothetical protein E4633_14815 [Geomonas terrae]|uniref:Uncharacterized protein n=1 Tax=Geomonas terrae TaxID=2562681 RepID=A0A4S1CDR8_9BACT|nr:hypothetical protein [Geomonas terrae]TGU71579.1 hypothetical protein E4633_14815 [Geomonas terrae]